ncbi:Conserved_hypothetical protein [Hexamita inflata]|uniref:Uncharacterized protein n=1 Tax=Hexamita inflata TaxID=28002 RepID=A0AA86TRY2_9EUKA|nr:Conserved hypothetical protein [Hexamita inflata]CAI9932059.1 Conserved hypothetical protein [Hexamita inflata]
MQLHTRCIFGRWSMRTANSILSNGICVCQPQYSILQYGFCVCTITGQSIVNGVCTCPAGSTLSGSTCVCNVAGSEIKQNTCVCTKDYKRYSYNWNGGNYGAERSLQKKLNGRQWKMMKIKIQKIDEQILTLCGKGDEKGVQIWF